MSDESKSFTELFFLVQDLADKLTFKRILTILLTGILITCTTLFYENRGLFFQTAYNFVTGTQGPLSNWDVSDETKSQLVNLVKTVPSIKFAMVTDIDLQKNRRVVKFWHLDDPEADSIRMKASTMLPQAVFDYDAKNTQQMVAVLNNEFVCSRFQDTVYQRFFPDMGKRLPIVCRIAIPPFYGKLVGMLTFGLKEPPTKAELDAIRIEAARLAVDIYLRDVVKKPAP